MDQAKSTALVVSRDELLVAAACRLAAAAGIEALVEGDPAVAAGAWRAPAVILLGADLAAEVGRLGPQRRDGVHVVCAGAGDATHRAALACGAESVLELPGSDEHVVALLADAGDGVTRQAPVIGVIGGVGGAGATCFAIALALAASERGSTALVDADVGGVGIDQLLGMDPGAGVRWDALSTTEGRISGRAVRDALPRWGPVAVLAHSPASRARGINEARPAIDALRRGFSEVVVDLPRMRDGENGALFATCTDVVLVTAATVPAVMAAARVVETLPGRAPVVLRRSTGGLDSAEVEEFLGRRVVAMRAQRGIDEDLALGMGPARRRRGALAVAARIVDQAIARAS